jgi:hypothetical protein
MKPPVFIETYKGIPIYRDSSDKEYPFETRQPIEILGIFVHGHRTLKEARKYINQILQEKLKK